MIPDESPLTITVRSRPSWSKKSNVESPLRVALDMRWMIPGLAGGLENLARSFMRQLISLDRRNAYTAILPAQCRFDFDLPKRGNFRIATRDSWMDDIRRTRHRILRAVHARLRLDYWESPDVLDLRFAQSLDAEIAYSFPGYIQPDLYPLRQVLMVPDIQHEYYPQFFSPSRRWMSGGACTATRSAGPTTFARSRNSRGRRSSRRWACRLRK